MEHLYEKLKQYQESDYYPCHMPGHKRNMKGYPMEPFYGIDITEIDGFDNLHQPEGILKSVMERAGRLFGADTYMLVNGSTGGILSAVSAVLYRGETLLMARNCHKSVYHAAYQTGCRTAYIYPAFLEEYGICGGISAADVKRALSENPEIKAVVLTSPTYDGIVSDVEAVVRAAHSRRIPVIVDAAHGAHFFLDKRFPESAVECGADIVIHSIHKTLPALTQTALLQVQGALVDRQRLERFLHIYQTSSPSYILLAGIEQCISILEQKGTALCNEFFINNIQFEKKLKDLHYLKVFSPQNIPAEKYVFGFDTGKKVISTRGTNLNGQALYHLLLEKYHLQMEMAGQDYVTAIMTIMDSREGFLRLAEALAETDETLQAGRVLPCAEEAAPPTAYYDIYSALEMEAETVPLAQCAGRLSAEFVHIYPPGIPLIVPGEQFTEAVTEQLLCYRRQGFTIEGMQDGNRAVKVIRKEIYA